MTARNVTVHLSVPCRVEGDAPVQEVGQLVAGLVELHPMMLRGEPSATRVTPLRVEHDRTHEKGGV